MLSNKRMNFVMPLKWPVGLSGNAGATAERLDSMLQTSQGTRMILALMSDSAVWYPELGPFCATAAEAAKKSAQANNDDFKNLGLLFWTSVIVCKQLLHYAYDSNGSMIKQRIVDGLNMYSRDSHSSFETYAGSCPEVDSFGNQMTLAKSVTLWQTLSAFMAHDYCIEKKWHFAAADAAAAAAAASATDATDATTQDFWASSSCTIDTFAHLTRCALATTGAIQRLHLDVLVRSKTRPLGFLGFTRNNGPADTVSFKALKNHITEIWRNYLFDISAMWMVVQRLSKAFASRDSNAVFHALHKARLWSLTTGLAGSSSNLMRLENGTRAYEPLCKVHDCSLVLHWLYTRLFGMSMKALDKNAYGSKAALARAVERMASGSFVAGDTMISDVPDCGTACLLDNHWAYTMLKPEQMGLVSDCATDCATHCGLLGSVETDLNHSVYVGLLCTALTQSEPHLWACVTEPKAWANNLDRGLPTEPQIERILQWQRTCSWALTFEDLKAMRQDFKKKHLQTLKNLQAAEIDEIMESL